MSIDGLTAIGARLTQIRSLVADVSAGSPGTSSATGTGFEAALAAALGQGTVASGGASTGAASGLTTGFAASGLSGLSTLSGLSALFSGAGGVVGLGSLSAVGSAGSSSVAAGSSSTAVLNADGVPADLAAYGNGRVPEAALAPVDGSTERMWAPAAEALNRLLAAAAADGVTIGVTDGYRSYQSQEALVRSKGLYSEGGLAAAPGTSEHGWGMAADLALDTKALAWMRANASRFDFAETTPRESWHWAYRPS